MTLALLYLLNSFVKLDSFDHAICYVVKKLVTSIKLKVKLEVFDCLAGPLAVKRDQDGEDCDGERHEIYEDFRSGG